MTAALLAALRSVCEVAQQATFDARAAAAADAAVAIGLSAIEAMPSRRDKETIEHALDAFRV